MTSQVVRFTTSVISVWCIACLLATISWASGNECLTSSGKCYAVYVDPQLTRDAAAEECTRRDRHGSLATILNSETHKHLEYLVGETNATRGTVFWIGAQPNFMSNWTMVNGTAGQVEQEATNTRSAEEQCVVLHYVGDTRSNWNATSCNAPNGFICEYKANNTTHSTTSSTVQPSSNVSSSTPASTTSDRSTVASGSMTSAQYVTATNASSATTTTATSTPTTMEPLPKSTDSSTQDNRTSPSLVSSTVQPSSKVSSTTTDRTTSNTSTGSVSMTSAPRATTTRTPSATTTTTPLSTRTTIEPLPNNTDSPTRGTRDNNTSPSITPSTVQLSSKFSSITTARTTTWGRSTVTSGPKMSTPVATTTRRSSETTTATPPATPTTTHSIVLPNDAKNNIDSPQGDDLNPLMIAAISVGTLLLVFVIIILYMVVVRVQRKPSYVDSNATQQRPAEQPKQSQTAATATRVSGRGEGQHEAVVKKLRVQGLDRPFDPQAPTENQRSLQVAVTTFIGFGGSTQ